MISVSKADLPSLEKYQEYLNGIWERGQLSNNGPLVQQLEHDLAHWLDVPELVLVNNATTALQMVVVALRLKHKVITTPFSFVATTSALVWQGIQPEYYDIHPETFCLDPTGLPNRIESDVSGILATHVFGNACDVEALETWSAAQGIPLIFDAAHAFGLKFHGKSLLLYGDASILSFHASKVLHTIEGGAIITKNTALAEQLREMRNFGMSQKETFPQVGINAKMTEFQAAMGLCLLPDVSQRIAERAQVAGWYDAELMGLPLSKMKFQDGLAFHNHAYYPVVFSNEKNLLKCIKALQQADIYPRRYFHPALNTLPYSSSHKSMPVAEKLANTVLALPMYASLSHDTVQKIAGILRSALC